MRGIRFCTRRPYRWSCPAAIQRSSIKSIGSDRHVLYVLQKPSVLYPSERCERVLAHMTACVAMVDPLVKGFKWLRKKAAPRRRRDLFRRLDILVVAEVAILLLTDEAGMAMRNSSTRAMRSEERRVGKECVSTC